MTEKTITICGKEVKMIYCAATENGYEFISGKSIDVFIPKFGKNEKGEDIIAEPANATRADYMMLGIAGITAYYSKQDEEPPVMSKDILYDATPTEVANLITSIVELRAAWYDIPKVVENQLKEEQGNKADEEKPKN